MIKRGIELRKAIDYLFAHNPFTELAQFKLLPGDWDALTTIYKILQILHLFQQVLSAEKTPTLGNTLPMFEAMKVRWEELQEDASLVERAIIQQGLNKLAEYRDRADSNTVYVLATLLNPAEKNFFEEVPNAVSSAQAKQILVQEVSQLYNITSANQRQTGQEQAQLAHLDQSARNQALARDQLYARRRVAPAPTPPRNPVEDEVNRYLQEVSPLTDTADSLEYWTRREYTYPTIFALAMSILPIQASSVPCERVFSSSKETMTPRRNCISAELMEQLQMLKYSVKRGRGLNFIEEFDKLKENHELEEALAQENQVPEDFVSFNDSLHVA